MIQKSANISADMDMLGMAAKEDLDKSIVESEGFDDDEESKVDASWQDQREPDVRFEAYAIHDQRILDSDVDIIRFDEGPGKEEQVLAEDTLADNLELMQIAKSVEEGPQLGGWKFQNPARVRQKIKKIIRRQLRKEDVMSEEEVSKVRC